MRQRILVPLLLLSLVLPLGAQSGERTVQQMLDSGAKLIAEKNLDQALAEYRSALQLEPNSLTALYNVGWIYNEQNKFDTAARFLKEATEKHADDYRLQTELGFALYKLGNADAALAAYEKATHLNAQSANGWLGLADVLYELKKDSARAAPAYARAVENGAKGVTPLYRLGWCYNDQNQFKEAVEALQKAAAVNSEQPAVWLELGYSQLKLKRFEAAVTSLNRSIALDKKQKLAHLYLGRAYLGLGQKDKVRSVVQTLRGIDADAAGELQAELQRK